MFAVGEKGQILVTLQLEVLLKQSFSVNDRLFLKKNPEISLIGFNTLFFTVFLIQSNLVQDPK